MRGRGAAFGGAAQRGGVTIGSNVVQTKSVQAMLQGACKSGVLKIANRELRTLPPEMFNLSGLDYGDKKWWLEDELRVVDVSNNELTVLPPDMAVFAESLRSLIASHNRINSIMTNFVTFTLLVKLDLSHNMLEGDLTAALGGQGGAPLELPELKECDLSHNFLTSASGFAHLPNLCTLNLSCNRLVAFETAMVVATRTPYRVLQQLDLSSNHLTEIPPLFMGCKALQTVDLSCNRLQQIDMGALSPAIVTLNLRQNQLTALPCPLLLPNLKDCILGNNKFTQLPDFSAAAAVSFLDVSGNKLTSVERAASLTQLVRLDLQNNDLSTLPPRLSLIKTLNNIVLDGNPLRMLRREIVAKGTVEVLKYLRSRLNEGDNDDVVPTSGDALAALQRAQQAGEWQQPAQRPVAGNGAPVVEAMPQRGSAYGYETRVVDRPRSSAGPAAPSAAGRGAAAAPVVKNILTTLGERNGALWDLSAAARGRTPMLPELLNMELIQGAAPATVNVVQGCSAWSVAGQSKLRWIDPQVVCMVAPSIREIDVSNTSIDSLDFAFQLPISIVGSASPPYLASLIAAGCNLRGPYLEQWCTGRSLVRIDLSRNGLTSLPEPLFANMSSLQYVNLNQNQLRNFPMVLFRLSALVELQIASNGLELMPDGAHVCWTGLQLLDLSFNELQTVPFTLGLMQGTLRTIKLEGNRMRWLRQTVLDKGTLKVLEFLRDKIAVPA